MDIKINKNSSVSIYKQIASALSGNILSGKIGWSSKLPSERKLAQNLNVHRNTVVKAYAILIDENLVSTDFNGKKGYYVCYKGLGDDKSVTFFRNDSFGYRLKKIEESGAKLFGQIYRKSFDKNLISFGGHIHTEALTPQKELTQIVDLLIKNHAEECFGYAPSEGLKILREAIADMLNEKGISVNSSNIMIINETAQGMVYLNEIFENEKNVVIMEEPACPDTVRAFIRNGTRVVTVPLEEDGINLEYLENSIIKYKPKCIHTMPDGNGQRGIIMSLEKRIALLNLAGKYDTPIIEEKWFSAIDYGKSSLPSLFMLDQNDSVIYLDDMDGIFYDGARIAYMIAPTNVIEKVNRLIDTSQLYLPTFEQRMLAEYLKQGIHRKQIQRVSSYYRGKRDLMERELSKLKPMGIEYNIPEGGMAFWVKLPDRINDMKLYEAALAKQVLICPGNVFKSDNSKENNFIRLSFSNISDEDIVKGISILGKVIENFGTCKLSNE